jgi:hypothetical protein
VRVIAAGCQLLWTEMCSCFNAAFVRMLNHGVRLPGGRDGTGARVLIRAGPLGHRWAGF